MSGLPKNVFIVILMLTVVVGSSLMSASISVAECQSDYQQYSDPSAIAMVADLVVVRPLTLVAGVAGAAIWVVALPATLLGGNVGEAGDVLVVNPMCYTFSRPLGYVGND